MQFEPHITDLSQVDRRFRPRERIDSTKNGWRISAEFIPKAANKPSSKTKPERRKWLKVALDGDGEKVAVIGINPSTAGQATSKDASPTSDMTLTKTAKVMNSIGFGEMVMLNLFDKISSHQSDIAGEKSNLHEYRYLIETADAVFVACGICTESNYPEAVHGAEAMLSELASFGKPILCVAKSNNGIIKQGLHPRVWQYNSKFLITPYRFE